MKVPLIWRNVTPLDFYLWDTSKIKIHQQTGGTGTPNDASISLNLNYYNRPCLASYSNLTIFHSFLQLAFHINLVFYIL